MARIAVVAAAVCVAALIPLTPASAGSNASADRAPNAANVDVGASITAKLKPKQRAALALGDVADAELPGGGTGDATLAILSCAGVSVCPEGGIRFDLRGSFKDENGRPLYGFGTTPGEPLPAVLRATCAGRECPSTDVRSGKYGSDRACASNECVTRAGDFAGRSLERDFLDYPVYVSMLLPDGSYAPYAKAGRCVPLPTSRIDPQRDALLDRTGAIVDPAAQLAGFCVDVNAITRAGKSWTGKLRIPVLFVEDPRFIIGRG